MYSNYDIYRDIVQTGAGVLGVTYPGFPGSTGAPSQKGIINAAAAHIEFLKEQKITADRFVYFGTSLGSAVAAQLTNLVPPSLLIMDASPNSIVDMGQKQMPFLLVSWLMKDQFRSDEALRGANVPMIWIHGTDDSIVPLDSGQKLFDGYDGPKAAHIIQRGQHTNLWGLGGREIVLQALKN